MPCCQCATTPLGELIAKSSFGRDRHRCYFPPEKLLLIPLRPGDDWQVVHPLLGRYTKNVRVEVRLRKREDGSEWLDTWVLSG